MSPVTHFLTGWVFANCAKLKPRDRAIVTLASVVPDLDGLGIVPELLTRNSSHPLLSPFLAHARVCIGCSRRAFVLATQRWKTGLLALLSFHLHLVEDLLGARGPDGYQWPIPYLKPFSSTLQLTWQGQWQLNAWPNIAITIVLLGTTLWLAWRRRFSPLEMISARLDSAFVEALRHRFPARTKAKG